MRRRAVRKKEGMIIMENNVNLTELQLLHQKQMQEKREVIRQRKARTHRLIVRGAIAENAIEGAAGMTDEEFRETLYRAFGKSGTGASGSSQKNQGSGLRNKPSADQRGSVPWE